MVWCQQILLFLYIYRYIPSFPPSSGRSLVVTLFDHSYVKSLSHPLAVAVLVDIGIDDLSDLSLQVVQGNTAPRST